MVFHAELWIKIGADETPRKGARLLVFTPAVNQEMRYRVCSTDDLPYLSAATHWQYLSPPAEFFSK